MVLQKLHSITANMDTVAFSPSQIICLEHEHGALYAEAIQILDEKKQVWARPIVLAILPAALHKYYYLARSTRSAESDYKLGSQNDGSHCDSSHDAEAIPWLHEATLFDLRSGADLLWPICAFRPALDVEIIPIVAQMGEPKQMTDGDRQANHAALQDFIHDAWAGV